MKGYLEKTEQFYDKEYSMNNAEHRKLSIGDICIVHPTPTSHVKKPYKVQIELRYWNWVGGGSVELTTSLHSIFEKGHSACMTENLFNRLEPVHK